jgi:hypothetical protein
MTPLTTAVAATRRVRVIRSPPGSQLERNRVFWRMISASFMQASDDIIQMIGCLRDGKEAVEQLKAMYPEEAKKVALDIRTKLGELALHHQASAQHQHPKPKPDVVVSSSDPPSSGDDSH